MTGGDKLSVAMLLKRGAVMLGEALVDGALRDARILLGHALECEPASLIGAGDEMVSPETAERFFGMIDERASGRPVHRIRGKRDFFGRDFLLNDACLEPRPETELLVERVLKDVPPDQTTCFCDIGTGSGVIALTLLAERPMLRCVATDINPLALKAARKNAAKLDVADRIKFVETDCMNGLEETFDFIVSNPPYVPTDDLAGLSREVREHDPGLALDGGPDGLDIYRRILSHAMARLVDGGQIYLETGHGQHTDISEMAGQLGWGIVETLLDLSGLERIVVLKKV